MAATATANAMGIFIAFSLDSVKFQRAGCDMGKFNCVSSIRPQLTEVALDYSAEAGRLRAREERGLSSARSYAEVPDDGFLYARRDKWTCEGGRHGAPRCRREDVGEPRWPPRRILFRLW